MVRADDVLELLLPGADNPALRRAREVTQFLRLLCDDARRSHAPAVGLDLQRARGVLDDHAREALERALSDLLRHYLAAVQPLDAFLWPGDPDLDAARAWREVEAARGESAPLPELPHPGESAFDGGLRVLSALESIAAVPSARLWRARWVHATEGPRAAERLYRELSSPGQRPRPSSFVQRAAVAGVAECLLERASVREARAWLGEHALQLSVDPRLRHLYAWTRLALEDLAGARVALQGLRPWSGPLPQSLCELRDDRPEWLPCLAGRGDPARDRGPIAGPVGSNGRADCGASAFVVLAFEPGRGNRVLSFDAAPALAGRRGAWLAEREGSSSVAGEREQLLVARALPLVEHAEPGGVLRGALGGSATRCLALAPILDDDGDAAGWIHVEFEHHLAPSRARLARWAAAWKRAALETRGRDEPESASPRVRAPAEGYADVFHRLVDDLSMKTTLRRWTGYSVECGDPVLVAEGGDGQGFPDFTPGRARALTRAIATGVRIDRAEPDEHLSVHAHAGSGVVLPLRSNGVTHGLLAVESSRRRDFDAVDLDVWSARADEAAIGLRVAQFRAWHREEHGFEPWFDPRPAHFRAFATRVARAARSRAPVTITGPAGVGKLVVARWLHFESGARGGPFVVHAGATIADRSDWSRLLERAAGGTLVIDDVDALRPEIQDLLEHEIAGPSERDATDRDRRPSARVVFTSRALDPSARPPSLRADLAARLERCRLRVPSLAERREEIVGLADALARRFAADERVAAPTFTDDAHALLWRQPWAGNVRELENLVYELVIAHPGLELSAEDVGRTAAESGRELVRRLSSRRPDRRVLLAALWTTRTGGARSNKTRAALYLGWDPDTLVARLNDAGLGDRVLDAEAWESDGSPSCATSHAGERSCTSDDESSGADARA